MLRVKAIQRLEYVGGLFLLACDLSIGDAFARRASA